MTLTNPSNQTKSFTPAEFYSFCMKVEKNDSFIKWAKQTNAQVRVNDGHGLLLSTSTVCAYLKEVGYKVDWNDKQI